MIASIAEHRADLWDYFYRATIASALQQRHLETMNCAPPVRILPINSPVHPAKATSQRSGMRFNLSFQRLVYGARSLLRCAPPTFSYGAGAI